MKIITLPQCGSTNSTLKEMFAKEATLEEGLFLRAVRQDNGRGQRGNHWESEPGKNLTFSFLLRPSGLNQQRHFLMSEAVALGVTVFLERFISDKNRIKIKWPNDIHVDGKKIAGILIENSLGTDGSILHSIIGIGLNVNQKFFTEGAPNAVSLTNVTGDIYELDTMMEMLAEDIMTVIEEYIYDSNGSGNILEHKYFERLWRAEGVYKWETPEGDSFMAEIAGIESTGKMLLREPCGNLREFWFKEVFPS